MKLLRKISFAQLCILFLVLLVIALAGSLTTMELRGEEPRRAVVAMEMILGKDWIIPKVHGMFYYNKPPLFNWLLAGMFKLTGSFGEIPLRLPSLFSFLLTAYLVYKIVKKYTDNKTGIIAALLLLSSADILFYGSVDAGEIDLFFAMLVFIQGISIFYYSQKQLWLKMFIISYTATAAGLLTKFLPALLFQGITLIVWLIYIRQFKKLFSWQHLAGIACFMLLAGSYFYVYSTRADLSKLFINLINESTQQSAMESNKLKSLLSFIKSPLLLFYIMLPGSLMLFYLCNKQVRYYLKTNGLFAFAVMFLVCNLPPYIFTEKIHNRYLYPFFPFAAIIFTCIYYAVFIEQIHVKKFVSYKAIVSICIFLAVVRICYNIWVIPYQAKTSSELVFRKLAAEIFAVTKNNPVRITGKMDTVFANPSLPIIDIKPDTLFIPPFIQSQVTYYCTRHTGTIMQYDSIPHKKVFYIVPVSDLHAVNVSIYKYFEGWQHRPLAIVVYN